MALSLAACGGSDDVAVDLTPFAQSDIDNAVATANAAAAATAVTVAEAAATAQAEAVAAVDLTTNDAEVIEAALTDASGIEYPTVDAAIAAAQSQDVSEAVAAAEAALLGDYADRTALIESNDAAVTATATDAAEATLMAGSGFASVADLLAAYNDASGAPTPLTLELTSGTDVVQGFTTGDDSVTGTQGTLASTDVLVDSNSGDNDTVTINSTTADLTGVKPVMSGIENVVFNFTTFAEGKVGADNIASGEVTVNQLQVGGSANATVDNASGITVTGGTGVTGTLTVNVDDLAETTVINAGNAATVTQADAATDGKAAVVTINGSEASTKLTGDTGDLGTVNLNGTATDVTLEATGATMNVVSAYEGTSTTGSVIKVVGSAATSDAANVTLGGIVALTNTGVETLNITSFADATVDITAASTTIDLAGSNDITVKALEAEVAGKTVTSTGTGNYVLRVTDAGSGNADLSKVATDVTIRIDDVATGEYIKVASGATIDYRDSDSNHVMDLMSSSTVGAGGDVVNVIANHATVAITNESAGSDGFSTINLSTATVASTVTALAGSAALNISGTKAMTLAATSTAGTVTNNGVSATYLLDGTDDVKIAGSATATDTIQVTLVAGDDLSNNTFSDVDVIKLSAALANAATTDEQTVVVKASQVSGESIAIIGTLGDKGAGTVADDNVTVKADQTTIDLGTLNIDSTTIEAVSIDLTSVQAASVNITGSNISESLSNVLTGAITIDGKGGADVITTGSGADNITSGEGGDTITGGLGADTIILTEATAATDTVVLTTGGALDLVTITGFSVAATNGDNLDISLADLNAIVTDMNTADAGTALATATGATLTVVEAGAYDLAGAASDMLVLDGDFVDGVAVATALEVNGDYALKVNGTVTAGDAFLIAYDNGTATNIAYVTSTAGAADDAAFATGDLTVTDFVTFTDIADATTILSANVDIVT